MFGRKLIFEDVDFLVTASKLTKTIRVDVKTRGIHTTATPAEAVVFYKYLLIAQRQGESLSPPSEAVSKLCEAFANALFFRGRAAHNAFFDPQRLADCERGSQR